MSRTASASSLSLSQARATLAARLRVRWPEIEQAAMARLYAVAPPPKAPGPEYLEGLRAAACAALEYLLAAIDLGEERSSTPPAEVLIQARQAARCEVSLDTVLRRCFAGYTLFGDFVMQEAEDSEELKGAVMKRLLRSQAALFDRLVAAVTDEYTREAETRLNSTVERRAERIERLLAGELLDTHDLDYDFEAHHLGLIAKGAGAVEVLRELSAALDRRVLSVVPEGDTVWAWLGGRDHLDLGKLEHLVSSTWPSHLTLAVGESAQGPVGWRLTHRQARATLPIALRSPGSLIRYADVALLVSTHKDELLVASLRELYLDPLEAGRDGGETLRKTLRAYFVAERNASSAAAALGVDRSTVANRLRTIEKKIGRPLSACAAEMEIALRWKEFDQAIHPQVFAQSDIEGNLPPQLNGAELAVLQGPSGRTL